MVQYVNSMELLFTVFISLLGLYGFILASHIHSKKAQKTKLVCPMRSNCDTVIHSHYSTIFGVSIEVFGMMYYAFIGGVYGIIFISGYVSPMIFLVLLWMSLGAVVFSVYLVLIQALVLRQWCSWCLMSASITILIFLLSYWHLGLI